MVARDGVEPPAAKPFQRLRPFFLRGFTLHPDERRPEGLAVKMKKNVEDHGGQGRNRTADASLFRAALYQLSYLATSRTTVEAVKKNHYWGRCTASEARILRVRKNDYNKAI